MRFQLFVVLTSFRSIGRRDEGRGVLSIFGSKLQYCENFVPALHSHIFCGLCEEKTSHFVRCSLILFFGIAIEICKKLYSQQNFIGLFCLDETR